MDTDCMSLLYVLVQNGLTALHLCAIWGHVHVMRSLVKEFSLDPNDADKVCIYDVTYLCL